jgi:hypothetical protein
MSREKTTIKTDVFVKWHTTGCLLRLIRLEERVNEYDGKLEYNSQVKEIRRNWLNRKYLRHWLSSGWISFEKASVWHHHAKEEARQDDNFEYVRTVEGTNEPNVIFDHSLFEPPMEIGADEGWAMLANGEWCIHHFGEKARRGLLATRWIDAMFMDCQLDPIKRPRGFKIEHLPPGGRLYEICHYKESWERYRSFATDIVVHGLPFLDRMELLVPEIRPGFYREGEFDKKAQWVKEKDCTIMFHRPDHQFGRGEKKFIFKIEK